MGVSLARRTLSEVEADVGDGVLFRFALNDVIKYGEPLFYVLRHRSKQGCMKRSYGVLLPLNDAGDSPKGPARPRYVLGACDWSTGD